MKFSTDSVQLWQFSIYNNRVGAKLLKNEQQFLFLHLSDKTGAGFVDKPCISRCVLWRHSTEGQTFEAEEERQPLSDTWRETHSPTTVALITLKNEKGIRVNHWCREIFKQANFSIWTFSPLISTILFTWIIFTVNYYINKSFAIQPLLKPILILVNV